jgi:hypothetical protein
VQYKIPQNVQIEDKIVGPLTLRQLIKLGIGGGITYTIYVMLAKSFYIEVWLIPVLIPGILTLLSTFVSIGGIPFDQWIFLSIEFIKNPRKRIFVMGAGDIYSATLFAEKTKKVQTGLSAEGKSARDHDRLQKIGEISKMLDSYGKPKTT